MEAKACGSGEGDIEFRSIFTSPEDGFVIVPRTLALLLAARTVTVVTNSQAVPETYFQTVTPRDGEAFVVFNGHRYTIDERLAEQTIWVHRRHEPSGRYYADPAESGRPAGNFHHVRVAAADPRTVSIPPGVSYLSYEAPLPGLAGYPVGRPLLVPRRGVRRIDSPSTGFLTFALLEELRRRGAGFRVVAVGVGREYEGWLGHDWKFERRRLHSSTIDFRMPDGRPDRWRTVLDSMPYEVVRAARKLMVWRAR